MKNSEEKEEEGGLHEKEKIEEIMCPKMSTAMLRRLHLRRLSAEPAKKTPICTNDKASSSSGERNRTCLSHGFVSLIGGRKEMEDTVTVAPAFARSAGWEYDFFSVFDGHGGVRVAADCKERMHIVLAEEARKEAAAAASEMEEEEEEFWWRKAIKASFARIDGEAAAETAREEGGGSMTTIGCTAVVALVGKRQIVIANCGDSRAVLSRGGAAIPLSSDHKPNRPDEMRRIKAAGGIIINWEGFRVLGVLATSRSIGDYYLKPYVSAEPEITLTKKSEEDEFLILASDGLWDVISNEVACRVTRRCLSGRAAKAFPGTVNGSSAMEAASLLAEIAMNLGSQDNISVVVIELKKLGHRSKGRRCSSTTP